MKALLTFIIVVSILSFSSCSDDPSKLSSQETEAWRKKSDSIIAITFDTLRSSLAKAIAEGNFEGAINFCREAAYPLTATYMTPGTRLKRVSDRYRNPANKPDEKEQSILAAFKDLKDSGKPVDPVFELDEDGNRHYFKPIFIQSLCLNCHGSRDEQIRPDVWNAIRQRYPSDLAFDYQEGDLRGLWHLSYNKN
ncbi:MAG TPA: DUF3365 domain-containing protein [Chitinophagaceae bacterium]|nr:DUF3365 domain-containing protein [Chitinophagaceae bacterium]HUM65138.1 DUF3365 domain-containing protein [Chitinophagaceae bacterium]